MRKFKMVHIKNKLLYEAEKVRVLHNRMSCSFKRPNVISMDVTIDAIRSRNASIARYGDGEFDLIFGRTEGYQINDKELADKLRFILKQNKLSERFLVAVPDCFGSLEQFTPAARLHWNLRLDKERIKWVRLLNTKSPYYNAQITRFYFDWSDKSHCRDWFEGLKSIWDGQDVFVVEGDKSRVGVGNDIFDNAKSVRRLLCPSENAFDYYDEILNQIKTHAKKSDLIFMALGPTATVLAYDLFCSGYWAFDAGHIDLEYEWMCMGATEKVKIPGKYVNEVAGGNVVEDINDQVYYSQIVGRVGV